MLNPKMKMERRRGRSSLLNQHNATVKTIEATLAIAGDQPRKSGLTRSCTASHFGCSIIVLSIRVRRQPKVEISRSQLAHVLKEFEGVRRSSKELLHDKSSCGLTQYSFLLSHTGATGACIPSHCTQHEQCCQQGKKRKSDENIVPEGGSRAQNARSVEAA